MLPPLLFNFVFAYEKIRDLDRECLELFAELKESEQAYIQRTRSRMIDGKLVKFPNVFSNQGSTLPTSTGGDKDGANGSSKSVSTEDIEGAEMLSQIDSLRQRIKQRVSQKNSISKNMSSIISKFESKLKTDLAFFETTLRSCGDFTVASGAQPGADVAISPHPNSDEMILGRVINFYADVGAYDIADIDDSKRYYMAEADVIVLDSLIDINRRLQKGEMVRAVYPDTTAFYLASVSVPPRRGAAGTEPVVHVQFQGDADDHGTTPSIVVPLKHVVQLRSGNT